MNNYIEKDCVFTHEGKSFESGGALVTDKHLIAYPSKDGDLHDWHGNKIGTYRVISERRVNSWQGTHYYYMRATVNGKRYSLRGFGEGMVATGKRIK